MNHSTNDLVWQPKTQLISANDLREHIEQHDVLVIHFGCDWNLSSQREEVTLAGVRDEFGDRVTFVAIDTDEKAAHRWCRVCEIITLPTLVCFVRGSRQENLVGEATKDVIADWLGDCLAKLTS